jgi:hypothetical protein
MLFLAPNFQRLCQTPHLHHQNRITQKKHYTNSFTMSFQNSVDTSPDHYANARHASMLRTVLHANQSASQSGSQHGSRSDSYSSVADCIADKCPSGYGQLPDRMCVAENANYCNRITVQPQSASTSMSAIALKSASSPNVSSPNVSAWQQDNAMSYPDHVAGRRAQMTDPRAAVAHQTSCGVSDPSTLSTHKIY